MNPDISIALIAFILLVGLIGSLVFFWKTFKILESAKKDIHNVSTEAIELIHKIDELVADIQSKSDSLDVVFHPLKSIRKSKLGGNTSETVSEIVEWVTSSLALFGKIRNAVKRREK
jgi:uncharacterized protein YoxC